MSEENNEVKTPDPAVEAEARKFGWVPQEDFKGDPAQWRDAETFIQRGREINGFLRNDLQKLTNQNKTLEHELLEVKGVVEEFKKFHAETEERAYKRALAELRAKKAEAVSLNDGAAVVEIDEQIEELRELRPVKQPEPAKKTQNPEDVAVFNAWLSDNSWMKDPVLQAAADGFSGLVKQENPLLIGRDFLDAVKAKVQENFPDKFRNTSRDLPPSVEGMTSTTPPPKKKSYANLPPEAKIACDKFVKTGLMTQDQYVKEYFEE